LPGMLNAAITQCPAHGGRLLSFDASRIMAMPGVRHVVAVGDNAVAVVAQTWWQAKKALEALPITWDEAAGSPLTTDAMLQHFREGLDATDVAIGRRDGDVAVALANAVSVIEAEYHVPYLAHTTMEPMTCTAHVVNGQAEVWAPPQDGEGTLEP
jgi:isoquinoline 1-oxidoreductase subunit beta